MIAFGSEEALAIKAADKRKAQRDELDVILEDIEVGVSGEVELMLPPHSFLMDVVKQVKQNDDDAEFLERLAYAHDEGKAIVAVCPDCKSAPLISAVKPRIIKDSLLELLWAICVGYEVRILPNDEAKNTFNAKQCTCEEPSNE